jgi:hypothetical protein
MKDREFLAEAQTLNADIDSITGEKTHAAVAPVLSTPKLAITQVQAALGGLPN